MDASGRLWPRADLRVGDADRDGVIAELQRHFVEGRLTSEELGERVSQTLAARTFADLAVLLADLPILSVGAPTSVAVSEPRSMEHVGHPEVLSLVLVALGALAMLWLFAVPGMHFGFMPFWPLMFWGFFFFGRSRRGRRNF